MHWWMVVLIVLVVLGPSTVLWTLVGLARRLREAGRRRPAPGAEPAAVLRPEQVVVLMAAHNEELVIARSIASAATQVPVGNVVVASDGSTDRTVEIARATGAQVLDLQPNRGKAGALAAAIEELELAERYPVLLLLDADTHLSGNYLSTGLPAFQAPDVVAVAGRATTLADPPPPTRWGRFLISYRERVYVAVQLLQKYGQAARGANVVSIVPGFASMYRTSVLHRIDIAAPGLAIEDFNMTFEVHAKRLGRIVFHPSVAVAYTQDPVTLPEYLAQTRRWTLGFWQTVRRHRARFDVFWAALSLFIAEQVIGGLVMLGLFPLVVVAQLTSVLPVWPLLLPVVLPDLMLTLLLAVAGRRPRALLMAPGFLLMRVLDAAVCFRSLGRAVRGRSDGRWASPTRRAVRAAAD